MRARSPSQRATLTVDSTAEPPGKVFDSECSICLLDVEPAAAPASGAAQPVAADGSNATTRHVLQCGHVFHRECIGDWLSRGMLVCPNCRAPQPGAGWAYNIL
jgi:hypothetical protein